MLKLIDRVTAPGDMKNSDEHRRLTGFALRIMGEIGGFIAVPAIVLTSLARRLDARVEGGKPQLFVFAILASFVITTVTVTLRAADYADRYRELTDDKGSGQGPGPGKTA